MAYFDDMFNVTFDYGIKIIQLTFFFLSNI